MSDTQAATGFDYAPTSQATEQVVGPGEFVFASACFDHGHIYGQTAGLKSAGGTLKWAWDPDPKKLDAFCEKHPEAKRASSLQEILDDPEVKLVTAAAIPCDRCTVGLQVLDAGKDYLTDKSPFTTLDQLGQARAKVADTGNKYMVCYSERLQNEAGWFAGELIGQGVIGEVVQILIMAPHRLSKGSRPDWFFEKDKYGGILTDIGSHQFEQFLTYAGAKDGKVLRARVDNFANPDKPGLEDFGEAMLALDNGVSAYARVDWFTPDGAKVWGDGRTFVMGTEGYLEVRKYRDIVQGGAGRIYVVNQDGEQVIETEGKVGFPFFGRLIRDCLDRTETAMTQTHAFKAAELSMKAQMFADSVR
ncbi:MAG: Gfo/Idh/MocA family protein [Opitutales bacterium]